MPNENAPQEPATLAVVVEALVSLTIRRVTVELDSTQCYVYVTEDRADEGGEGEAECVAEVERNDPRHLAAALAEALDQVREAGRFIEGPTDAAERGVFTMAGPAVLLTRGDATADAADEWAFRTFARAYPHEAHGHDADRFWGVFQEWRPGVTREAMEAALSASASPAALEPAR